MSTWPIYALASPSPKEQNHWAVSDVEVEKLRFKCAKIIEAREFLSSSQLYNAVTVSVGHCTTGKERVIQTTLWECKMKNMASCK